MSILKELLAETAVGGSIGAGAIAANPNAGFASPTMITRVGTGIPKKKKRKRKLRENDANDFNPQDVLSKLKSSERQIGTENKNKDIVTFGMQDSNGHIVKVSVRADQADDFENELGTLLNNAKKAKVADDFGEEEKYNTVEIAEILFSIKNKYDLVDVDWGDIPEDEENQEQAVDVTTDDKSKPDDAGMGDIPKGGVDLQGGQPPIGGDAQGQTGGAGTDATQAMEPPPADDSENATSALKQVIDMLKADAEAKKAEAEAKTAQAKAEQAKYAAELAKHHVKRQEEILDMETYNKQKAEKSKEAKTIAKLAKFKHELEHGKDSNPFESAKVNVDEIDITEIGDYIFNILKVQN